MLFVFQSNKGIIYPAEQFHWTNETKTAKPKNKTRQ